MHVERIFKKVETVGDRMIEAFHIIGLFVIGATVIWSGVYTYLGMLEQGHASLKDILLLTLAVLILRYGDFKCGDIQDQLKIRPQVIRDRPDSKHSRLKTRLVSIPTLVDKPIVFLDK